jgi:poly(3-hydroxybutyrate) depolymerase
MKRMIFLLSAFLTTCLTFGQVVTKVPKSATNTVGFVEVKPSNYTNTRKYALYVFLHGRDGQGDGTDSDFGLNRLTRGELPKELVDAAEKYGFVVLAPQCPSGWNTTFTNHCVNYAKANLSIDWVVNRNEITGLSMGGGGVWQYISSSVANANNFATAVVICGTGGMSNAQVVADSKIAVWAFHAKNDGTVGYSNTTSAVNAINARNPVVPAYMTLYETGDHWIWGKVYDPAGKPGIKGEPVNTYEWAAMNEVGKPVAVPQAGPGADFVAKAAMKISTKFYYNDTTVATPIVNLDGTTSTGAWKSASWKAIAVPPGVSIWEPVVSTGGGWITATTAFPKEGTYTMQLAIKDINGKESTDNIVITYTKEGTPPPPDPKKELGRIFIPKLNLFIVVYDDGTTGPLQ